MHCTVMACGTCFDHEHFVTALAADANIEGIILPTYQTALHEVLQYSQSWLGQFDRQVACLAVANQPCGSHTSSWKTRSCSFAPLPSV